MADSQNTRIASENPLSPLAAAIKRHKAAYWAYRARADFDPEIADGPYRALGSVGIWDSHLSLAVIQAFDEPIRFD